MNSGNTNFWEEFNEQCQSIFKNECIYRVPPEVIEFCEYPVVKQYANRFTIELKNPRIYSSKYSGWLQFIHCVNGGAMYLNCDIYSDEYGSVSVAYIGGPIIIYSNVTEMIADIEGWFHVVSDIPTIDSDKFREDMWTRNKFDDGGRFADAFLSKYDSLYTIEPIRDILNKIIIRTLTYKDRGASCFTYWAYLERVSKNCKIRPVKPSST